MIFKTFEEIYSSWDLRKKDPEYVLVIYTFQFRKFAIVGKKVSLEVQKISIYISSTPLPLMLCKRKYNDCTLIFWNNKGTLHSFILLVSCLHSSPLKNKSRLVNEMVIAFAGKSTKRSSLSLSLRQFSRLPVW